MIFVFKFLPGSHKDQNPPHHVHNGRDSCPAEQNVHDAESDLAQVKISNTDSAQQNMKKPSGQFAFHRKIRVVRITVSVIINVLAGHRSAIRTLGIRRSVHVISRCTPPLGVIALGLLIGIISLGLLLGIALRRHLLCGITLKRYLLCGVTLRRYLLRGVTLRRYLLCGITLWRHLLRSITLGSSIGLPVCRLTLIEISLNLY